MQLSDKSTERRVHPPRGRSTVAPGSKIDSRQASKSLRDQQNISTQAMAFEQNSHRGTKMFTLLPLTGLTDHNIK